MTDVTKQQVNAIVNKMSLIELVENVKMVTGT